MDKLLRKLVSKQREDRGTIEGRRREDGRTIEGRQREGREKADGQQREGRWIAKGRWISQKLTYLKITNICSLIILYREYKFSFRYIIVIVYCIDYIRRDHRGRITCDHGPVIISTNVTTIPQNCMRRLEINKQRLI